MSNNKPIKQNAKKAKKRTNGKKKTPKESVSNRNGMQHGEISKAAADYALALADPFGGPLATIPDFPSVPSRRVRCFSRGFFSTGTAQIGFCVVDPYRMAAKDYTCVFKSDSTYTGTTIAVAGGGVSTAVSNSDYVSTDFGDGNLMKARIVSAGIRIRYSSTELNRGGVVLGIQSPNHQSLWSLDFAAIDGYDCSGRFRPTQSWVTVRYCPIFQNELLYTSTLGTPNGVIGVEWPIMGFIVQAPASGTPISFEYEAFLNFEGSGRDVRGILPSAADPAGFAAVQTTVQSAMMRPVAGDLSSHGKRLVNAVHDVAHHTLTGFTGRLLNSGVDWLEREGASFIGGLAALL